MLVVSAIIHLLLLEFLKFAIKIENILFKNNTVIIS